MSVCGAFSAGCHALLPPALQLSLDRGHEPVLLSGAGMFLQESSRTRNPHLLQSCRLFTTVTSDRWDECWRWSDLWVYIPPEKRKCSYFYHEGILSFNIKWCIMFYYCDYIIFICIILEVFIELQLLQEYKSTLCIQWVNEPLIYGH